jgi:glycosyltransferase involved in cell wall biosynthesis
MRSVRVSVVVPTYGREELLRRNLHALFRQTLSPDLYEIIVAHQESGDGTAEVLASLAERHPSLRYIRESRSGVAHARNAGLYAAQGEIVVCTDDDAFAPPHWLQTILRVFDEVRPSPHVVGGPILPLVIGRRPDWFQDRYEALSWGGSARFLRPGERRFPTGNVAYRRELLIAAGGFDPALGMKGDIMGFAEDDEVFDRLRLVVGEDLRAYYQPGAYVWHAVPDQKMRVTYVLKRAFVSGQTRRLVAARKPWRARTRALASEMIRLAKQMGAAVATMPPLSRPGDWLVGKIRPLASGLGYLTAACGIRVRLHR